MLSVGEFGANYGRNSMLIALVISCVMSGLLYTDKGF